MPLMPLMPMLVPRSTVDDVEAPSSVQVEVTVLGILILYQELVKKARLVLRAKDFSLDSHQIIYAAIVAMNEENEEIDLITLDEFLKSKKKSEAIGGPAYLMYLTEGIPQNPSIDSYLKIIKNKSLLRRVIDTCYAGIEDVVGDPAEICDRLQKRLADIARDATRQTQATRNILSGGLKFAMAKNAQTEWLVDGVIQRRGNGLIVASPGAAKSWLCLDLAIHIATGTTWMGKLIKRPANVAYVSREDAPELTQARLHALVNGANEYLHLQMHTHNLDSCLFLNTRAELDQFSLQSESDVREMIENFKNNQIEIAFFDVFRRLWEGDENDNREVAKVLATLTRIQTESGASCVLVHHLSKGDGSVFDRIRGSTSIYGWREWAMGLTVENPDAPPSQRVRKIVFETKAALAADPLYFKVEEKSPGHVHLIQAEEPQQTSRSKRGGNF